MPDRNEITTGCAAFSMEEEPYQFEMINTDAKREVLLRYIYQGKEYLGGWSLESQAGRLVFLAPGHTPEQFACEAYGKLIRTCANWCMKNE